MLDHSLKQHPKLTVAACFQGLRSYFTIGPREPFSAALPLTDLALAIGDGPVGAELSAAATRGCNILECDMQVGRGANGHSGARAKHYPNPVARMPLFDLPLTHPVRPNC